MAQQTLSVRKNADGTMTIRSGKYKESVEIRSKTPFEKFEAVKWAILTAGFAFTEEVEEIVRKELYS
jgi:transglutaminase-like putative cysteine protease